LKDQGRVRYESVDDRAALAAFRDFAGLEGIIPALETAHAIAWIRAARAEWRPEDLVLLCLSGRGDKDVAEVVSHLGRTA
jgi:tryptophan synthase beta chain